MLFANFSVFVFSSSICARLTTYLVLIFVCLSTPVHAELVRTRLATQSEVPAQGYASIKAAVIAASNLFNGDSITFNREHVGGILKCKKAYYFTHGVGENDVAPVQFSIGVPKGCKLSALWHTHGGNFPGRQYFSPDDTLTADRIGKSMYMADSKGSLRVYKPKTRKLSRMRRTSGSIVALPRGAAKGKLVRDNAGLPVNISTLSEQTVALNAGR